jgi:dihydroneopterin aldolase/2-amino-4-hydroxy-6-hydroxymethyldihydropteridine diphosphokinase
MERMDKLVLSGMEFFGNHGVFPEENRLGQRFRVDLELFLDLTRACSSDDLEHTINYAEVYGLVLSIVENETFRLIEALAGRIASGVLHHYTDINAVTVRVIKPHPPFKIFFEGVTVEIHRKRPITAYIGMGSNIGDREDMLKQAVDKLQAHPSVRIKRCSSLYETDPVGYTEQPPFLNMVAAVETDLAPDILFQSMLEVERKLGRTRDIRWGPRTIDLDLLLYGEETIRTDMLTVPHPRLWERAFVLIPLHEVAGDFVSSAPGLLPDIINKLDEKEGVRKWKEIHWPCG